MRTNEVRSTSPSRSAGASLGVGLLVLLALTVNSASAVGAEVPSPHGVAATTTAASPSPQLSITVDNGRTAAAAGDTLTYAVTVQNLGATPVNGLQVTQSIPSGLTFGSVDAAGLANPSGVIWHLDLSANGAATLHSTMSVSATPKELLRLATVACASVSATGPPIVCASHSDLLPAGREAAAASKAATASGGAHASNKRTWYIGGLGGTVLALCGLALLMARRRKLAMRPAAEHE